MNQDRSTYPKTALFAARQSIINAMIEKAVHAGEPSGEQQIISFEQSRSIRLHLGFLQLYGAFSSIECNSRLIALWPLERIQPSCISPTHFLIGDYMLNAENIVADLTDDSAPVILETSRTALAMDFDGFIASLVTDNLYPD